MVIHQTNFKYFNAFSLIEVLIVVSIVLMSVSVIVVSTTSFARSKTLESQTNMITETLELAKKKAVSGDKSLCSSTLNGYKVVITSPTTFILSAVCSAGDVIVQSYTIPNKTSVSIVSYTSANTLFTPLSQAITQNCIVLQAARSNECRQITISSAGTINVVKGPCSC